ncbi:NAD kinase [Paramicrobacterium chengjingii]|uniref:NAD kinase n=1 Tax=Paramicrobacterium chengjingii TaxID=2769067 RepID=A0ABX6YEB9_9MICO|nr:NAD kinase [Microbacterium chengjingii]QPZ37103.1 NAD kinase [Microbacterium chengjingii]
MTTLRSILVVSHTGRSDSIEAAANVIRQLRESGIRPVLVEEEREQLMRAGADIEGVDTLDSEHVDDLELVMVLGGDGTILRAAELVRDHAVPMLGVNLGHVGFLAELERDDLANAVQRVVERDYAVEERMTLDVSVTIGGEIVYATWALNEATVEKASRERMLELVVQVDQRPLVSFGADGAVISTPTGSTAYNFSAGGPIIWPTVEAITLVPLSAHALFAKPIVIAPDSTLAIDVLGRSDGIGVLWCDGRRTFELEPGSRVNVERSDTPVKLARLHDSPFTDRLVRKFHLPVSGWRGPAA